jgi:uncharacterized protein YndB with AHSA1/START domain
MTSLPRPSWKLSGSACCASLLGLTALGADLYSIYGGQTGRGCRSQTPFPRPRNTTKKEAPVKVQGSIGIGAPPEIVWPFLVEPERILKWYTLLRRFEYTSEQHAGVGTAVYMEEEAGVSLRVSYVVTEWVEKEKLAFRMTSGNFVKGYEQTWTLERIPTGSRFTLAEDVTMPYGPVGRVLGAFSRSSSERHIEEILAKLKALAEAEVVAAPVLAAGLTVGPAGRERK